MVYDQITISPESNFVDRAFSDLVKSYLIQMCYGGMRDATKEDVAKCVSLNLEEIEDSIKRDLRRIDLRNYYPKE